MIHFLILPQITFGEIKVALLCRCYFSRLKRFLVNVYKKRILGLKSESINTQLITPVITKPTAFTDSACFLSHCFNHGGCFAVQLLTSGIP